jgi:2-polyprenyl-6-hydroxyphenyl methylase/3-demethylubiquinone-9 3-methyltransferase
MKALLTLPFLLQGIVIFVDEFKYHHKRGLPRWERIGHPIDSFFYSLPLLWSILFPPTEGYQIIFLVMAIFSTFIIIKDEKVHKEFSSANEQYLHALLFILHPVCLINVFLIWPILHGGESLILTSFHIQAEQHQALRILIYFQAVLSLGFCLYQIIYWNFIRKDEQMKKVNNDYYDTLNDDWYEADDDPIALLKAEQKLKNKWIEDELLRLLDRQDLTGVKILDIGCGGGFLTNYLATKGVEVTGIDQSVSSLRVAEDNDKTNTVKYLPANAYQLPFGDESFDFVFAMDFLEHVESPEKVISEASRVLKKKGSFFYHTFNRNLLAWLVIIKMVEWFLPKTPKDIHILRLFIKPKELEVMMSKNGLSNQEINGMGPVFLSSAFFWSLLKRRIHPDFDFELKSSKLLAYMGHAGKL